MFVTVRILKGYPKPLTYKADNSLNVGDIVTVPLRNRTVFSVVTQINVKKPRGNFDIRSVEERVAQPNDSFYQSYIKRLSHFYCLDTPFFYERLYTFLGSESTQEVTSSIKSASEDSIISLTDAQRSVVNAISKTLNLQKFSPHLLHGVTGSGKTEVYKTLIEQVLLEKKSVLFLCPEVSLARILAKRLASHKGLPVHVFDSQSTKKEKEVMWSALMHGQPIVIVGVHLPVLLPVPQLGLIIIDEEHAQGFAEKKSPYINSKQCALLRAQHQNIPILLGSATPSVPLVHYAQHHPWQTHSLTERYAGNFPKVELISLRDPHKRKHFWFTPKLISEISKTIGQKKQVIVYINRRGFSVSMQCKQCGELFECPNCSVSLTVHKDGDDTHLECHYCNKNMLVPKTCTSCKQETEKISLKGVGTQQVVSLLETIFPNARIARGDADASRKKKSWKETLAQFESGEIDILVGTQLITKGYDFPNVTLVGVLWGDNGLHYPSYTAHEEALRHPVQIGRGSCREGVV